MIGEVKAQELRGNITTNTGSIRGSVNGGGSLAGALATPVLAGIPGATFTPHMSDDGTLSWTNDWGLDNPDPVNLKGEPGDDGRDGQAGKDGYTPKKGVDYFDGKDGQAGKDGTPCTHSWSGTTLYVTSASGTSYANLKGDKGDRGDTGTRGADGYTPRKNVDYFDGKDGQDGKDGADGYTPIKGKDYYTDADKAEMVNAVIAALPKYNGEVTSV